VAINYVVKADVVDIQSDRPRPFDGLLIDSNIWFWMTYNGAGLGNDWRARAYPNYLRAARRVKVKIFRCGLSVAEIAHLFERIGYEIFSQTHPGEDRKEFRCNYPAERASIVTDVQNAWRIVKSLAAPLDVNIDETITDAAVSRLHTQFLDGYDLFMVEAMSRAGITQLLTDDGDYCTVPDIQVFTANRKVIEAARAVGKLLLRPT
jgi:hypothetical protein